MLSDRVLSKTMHIGFPEGLTMNKNSFLRSSLDRRLLPLSAFLLFMFFFTVMGKTTGTKYKEIYIMKYYSLKSILTDVHGTIKYFLFGMF